MQTLLSGDVGYSKDDKICELQSDIGKVERMLKALTKSFENKHVNPGILESLTPFSQLFGRRTTFQQIQEFFRHAPGVSSLIEAEVPSLPIYNNLLGLLCQNSIAKGYHPRF